MTRDVKEARGCLADGIPQRLGPFADLVEQILRLLVLVVDRLLFVLPGLLGHLDDLGTPAAGLLGHVLDRATDNLGTLLGQIDSRVDAFLDGICGPLDDVALLGQLLRSGFGSRLGVGDQLRGLGLVGLKRRALRVADRPAPGKCRIDHCALRSGLAFHAGNQPLRSRRSRLGSADQRPHANNQAVRRPDRRALRLLGLGLDLLKGTARLGLGSHDVLVGRLAFGLHAIGFHRRIIGGLGMVEGGLDTLIVLGPLRRALRVGRRTLGGFGGVLGHVSVVLHLFQLGLGLFAGGLHRGRTLFAHGGDRLLVPGIGRSGQLLGRAQGLGALRGCSLGRLRVRLGVVGRRLGLLAELGGVFLLVAVLAATLVA